MKDLPKFQRRQYETVVAFANQMLTRPTQPENSYFRKLAVFDDGHYRVVFSLAYLAGDAAPTKSQWNSLKKKFKRHDKRIFVFKQHGLVTCDSADEQCGYIEFGYFAH